MSLNMVIGSLLALVIAPFGLVAVYLFAEYLMSIEDEYEREWRLKNEH